MGNIKEWLLVFFLSIVLAISVKSCAFDVFTVPTTSMISSLLPGDVVLVNKLSYGAKITSTPLTLPFSHQHIPFTNLRPYSEIVRFPYMRLPGFGSIERNDLMVFHYPMDDLFPIDHRTYFIKRVVALPGDSLVIQNDELMVNGDLIKTADLSFTYRLKTKDDLEERIASLNIYEGGRVDHNGQWELVLNENQKEQLLLEHQLDYLEKSNTVLMETSAHIFPFDESNGWNLGQYGPIYIPRKGDTLALSKKNIHFYKRIIEEYEGHNLSVSPMGEIYIDKVLSDAYVFEQNYFFVLGDNRHNSSDSRYWGYLPEDHVVGEVIMVLYSSQKGTHHSPFNRFLKQVD